MRPSISGPAANPDSWSLGTGTAQSAAQTPTGAGALHTFHTLSPIQTNTTLLGAQKHFVTPASALCKSRVRGMHAQGTHSSTAGPQTATAVLSFTGPSPELCSQLQQQTCTKSRQHHRQALKPV